VVGGAGGNRTLVRQAVTGPATTIPVVAPLRPARRRVDCHRGDTAGSFSDARGLCLRSAVSPAVHHYFCCRAVVVRPRASLLITVTLFARWLDQAARANCSLAILFVPRLASLSNSGRMNGFRSQRRNRLQRIHPRTYHDCNSRTNQPDISVRPIKPTSFGSRAKLYSNTSNTRGTNIVRDVPNGGLYMLSRCFDLDAGGGHRQSLPASSPLYLATGPKAESGG